MNTPRLTVSDPRERPLGAVLQDMPVTIVDGCASVYRQQQRHEAGDDEAEATHA
jgi:hypothetical protein